MKGRVFFVGAGPGAVDLLTVRAVRVLERADVVLHDDLVPIEIVELAPPNALVFDVGKRCGQKGSTQQTINDMMIDFAREGRAVVRLKSGDPALFGRLGEEMDALREAGVEFDVVPGVTAALAAAAGSSISLTDRRYASRVVFATASLARDARQDWPALLAAGTTVVIYMPGRDYARLASELMEAGAAADLPCAMVTRAGTVDETTAFATLQTLHNVASAAPSLVIVGEVVAASQRFLSSHPEEVAATDEGALFPKPYLRD
jgi:uroporphyrin-III C-methyltransferase